MVPLASPGLKAVGLASATIIQPGLAAAAAAGAIAIQDRPTAAPRKNMAPRVEADATRVKKLRPEAVERFLLCGEFIFHLRHSSRRVASGVSAYCGYVLSFSRTCRACVPGPSCTSAAVAVRDL